MKRRISHQSSPGNPGGKPDPLERKDAVAGVFFFAHSDIRWRFTQMRLRFLSLPRNRSHLGDFDARVALFTPDFHNGPGSHAVPSRHTHPRVLPAIGTRRAGA